jgi:hypothetical protein
LSDRRSNTILLGRRESAVVENIAAILNTIPTHASWLRGAVDLFS